MDKIDRKIAMRAMLRELDRDELAAKLQIKAKTAIANAVTQSYWPASWYFVLSDMCLEKKIACPDELFKMRPYR